MHTESALSIYRPVRRQQGSSTVSRLQRTHIAYTKSYQVFLTLTVCAVPGAPMQRARSSILGSILGALVSLLCPTCHVLLHSCSHTWHMQQAVLAQHIMTPKTRAHKLQQDVMRPFSQICNSRNWSVSSACQVACACCAPVKGSSLQQIGYPTASLQKRVDERLLELHPEMRPAEPQTPTSRYPILEGNPADSVIRQLESSQK